MIKPEFERLKAILSYCDNIILSSEEQMKSTKKSIEPFESELQLSEENIFNTSKPEFV